MKNLQLKNSEEEQQNSLSEELKSMFGEDWKERVLYGFFMTTSDMVHKANEGTLSDGNKDALTTMYVIASNLMSSDKAKL